MKFPAIININTAKLEIRPVIALISIYFIIIENLYKKRRIKKYKNNINMRIKYNQKGGYVCWQTVPEPAKWVGCKAAGEDGAASLWDPNEDTYQNTEAKIFEILKPTLVSNWEADRKPYTLGCDGVRRRRKIKRAGCLSKKIR